LPLIFDFSTIGSMRSEFEGCLFISVLLEFPRGGREHRAASAHLERIREIVLQLARDAGLARPNNFAQVWHMLMHGSIVSAGEGNRDGSARSKVGGKASC
jgi:hypothetical protein